jgi:hypothetical protein
MLAQLNDRQTATLMVVVVLAITYVIVKVIDAFNRRGERFHERYLTFKEADTDTDIDFATPTPERRPVKIDGLGEVGIKAHRPVKDTPQA